MSAELYTQLAGQLGKALAGKDILLSIWDATGSALLAVAGQQGLTINRDKDTIEVTAKDSTGGWKQNIVGFKEWSIDNDGVYIRDHDSHKLLKATFEGDTPVLIKITNQKAKTDMFGGLALLTSYPIDAPYDDTVTYTISLTGTGALVDLEDVASAPNVSVAISPLEPTVAVSGTKQMTATVINSANQSVTWTSSNPDVATISAGGLVTVLGTATAGETTVIRATSVADPTKSAYTIVTVG